MKTTALYSLAIVVALFASTFASAQQTTGAFQFPIRTPIGQGTIRLGIPGFPQPTAAPVQPNMWNPVIASSQPQLSGLRIDPNTGQIVVQTKSTEVKASALDPNRNVIDPGSYRVSSSIFRDYDGTVYEAKKVSWTSYGVPHGKTTRKVVSGGRTPSGGGLKTEQIHDVVSSRVRQESTTQQIFVPVLNGSPARQ